MDIRTLQALEFDALKTLIASHLRTSLGAAALARLAPQADAEVIRARKRLVDDAVRHHETMGRLGPGDVPDPAPILARLRPEGVILDGQEVRKIGVLLGAASERRRHLAGLADRFPALSALAGEIPDLAALSGQFEGRIAPNGDLEDKASARLAEVRRRIVSLEARLQRSLQEILERSEMSGLLQDNYIAVRNGRFVIPVLAEARQRVPGIVHGASSTGATVFVEPIQTLDLNNDLVTLREEEGAEVRRILGAWTAMLRERVPEIAATCEQLGALDLLGGIGAFAKEWDCAVAQESGEGRSGRGKEGAFVLEGARHPILHAGLRGRGAEPVPLEVAIDAGTGALIISGPNAGGKTVALKTVGLLALMNQAALPVPARAARMPIFRQILADIGDHQSIEQSLSTFSARMVHVAEMMRALDVPALVLLDEVGAGTDAEEAGALAVAIVDRFRRTGAAIVATTHLEALKAYAEATPGAVNAAMEIDETTMRPTYHLRSGAAGRSGGLDLAARMGLPQEVIEEARGRMSALHRETQAYLDRLRETAAAREREIETMRRERAAEREQTEAEIGQLKRDAELVKETWGRSLKEALERIDRERDAFLARIEDRTIRLQLTSEARQQSRALREHLAQSLAKQAPIPAQESPGQTRHHPGDRVRVRTPGGSSEVGTIESVDLRGGMAMVLVHGMRMRLGLEDLEALPMTELAGRAPVVPRGVRLDTEDKGKTPAELNVIGATVEEALDRLDKFLDDAFLAGHREVRIVHGHGTGRLRSAVRQFLASHPHVESHAGADRRGGGDGATVAVLAG